MRVARCEEEENEVDKVDKVDKLDKVDKVDSPMSVSVSGTETNLRFWD